MRYELSTRCLDSRCDTSNAGVVVQHELRVRMSLQLAFRLRSILELELELELTSLLMLTLIAILVLTLTLMLMLAQTSKSVAPEATVASRDRSPLVPGSIPLQGEHLLAAIDQDGSLELGRSNSILLRFSVLFLAILESLRRYLPPPT